MALQPGGKSTSVQVPISLSVVSSYQQAVSQSLAFGDVHASHKVRGSPVEVAVVSKEESKGLVAGVLNSLSSESRSMLVYVCVLYMLLL
jgi:hypothetical protein